MVGPHGRKRRAVFVLGLFVASVFTGCVHRRYTIRTEPPGALAIVNGQEMGLTPVSAPFVYYGDREIILIKDGCQTQRVVQPIKAPWWDNMLTEFFTENLVPVNLRDERDFTFAMTPSAIPDKNELLQRGESLRAQGQVPPPPRRTGFLGFLGL